jgi:hypothetical protein
MNLKTFCTVTGAIFAVIALIHLARIFFGWHVTIGGWTVPMWMSWIGFIVASGLAYLGLKYSAQKHTA